MLRPMNSLQYISHWDQEACIHFSRLGKITSIQKLFWIVSRLGDGPFWAFLALTLCLNDRDKATPFLLHMALTRSVCLLLYKWVKTKTLRPRPYQVHSYITCGDRPLDQYSFPSGHTMHAVAFSLVVSTFFPALFWAVVPFTALVAVSRVVLGLHYPSDVIAGALLGLVIPSLIFSFY